MFHQTEDGGTQIESSIKKRKKIPRIQRKCKKIGKEEILNPKRKREREI